MLSSVLTLTTSSFNAASKNSSTSFNVSCFNCCLNSSSIQFDFNLYRLYIYPYVIDNYISVLMFCLQNLQIHIGFDVLFVFIDTILYNDI